MPAQRKVISDAEIAGAAKAAGFSGANLAKAVAIALAESGGNIYAHNAVPPDNSYGLWQINMLGSMGPARRKQFGLKSNTDLFNPTTNAKAAYAIAGGGKNFRPWSTYTSGAYLRYLSRANKAAGNPSASVPGIENAGFLDDVNPIPEIVDFFEFLSDPKTWLRLGMILGGAALVVLSLIMLSGATGRAKTLLNAAGNVLPQGRALKAAGAATRASKGMSAASGAKKVVGDTAKAVREAS